MTTILLQIKNICIPAGIVILIILAIRPFLLKYSKRAVCILWLLAGIRLLVPYSFESNIGFLPQPKLVSVESESSSGTVTSVNEGVRPVQKITTNPIKTTDIAAVNLETILTIIWVTGIVIMCIYFLWNYFSLKKRVQFSIPLCDRVYISDRIDSPFILGILSARIYLPESIDLQDMDNVIAHEKQHLYHKDHLWKAAGFFFLAVYWFHPLVWVAYFALCHDLELACDERVIQTMKQEERKAYAMSLLKCSMPKYKISVSTLAFGDTEVKRRVKSVTTYKKITIGGAIIIVLVVVLCAGIFFSRPKGFTLSPGEEKIEVTKPALDLTATTGADGAILDFADKDYIYTHGYYGFFVYDRNENMVTESLDLHAIGCDATQGDEYCEVQVSEDGSEVYFHVLISDEMYTYYPKEDILTKRTWKDYPKALYTGTDYAKDSKWGDVQVAKYTDSSEAKQIYLYDTWSSIENIKYSTDLSKNGGKKIFGNY